MARKKKVESEDLAQQDEIQQEAGMKPQSEKAKAKSEKDYACHPKFDKFKGEE